YVTRHNGKREIAAFVNAKGSCSYRRFRHSGEFISVQRSKGEFAKVFSTVIISAVPFSPSNHPALVHVEKNGLPTEVVAIASTVLRKL
ncbi:MAG: hypothetical protein ACRD36_12370, partial [Candidatus Acidiferrum sp.]